MRNKLNPKIRIAISAEQCGQMASALIMDELIDANPDREIDRAACIVALTSRGWGEDIARDHLDKAIEMARLVLRPE